MEENYPTFEEMVETCNRGLMAAQRTLRETAKPFETQAAMQPETPLSALENRLRNLSLTIGDITERLDLHADRVHGTNPREEDTHDQVMPEAAMGRVFAILNHIENKLFALNEAVDRNCNLA